ncbi:MAG TPA: lipocalin family protein [Blastocatellia bacterium]|nr:lipocalin family protein [Blastocatellia bacterium]
MKTKHIVIAVGIVCFVFFMGLVSVIGIGLIILSADAPASSTQTYSAAYDEPQATAAASVKQDEEAVSNLVGSWVKAAAVNSGNRNSSSGGWSSGSNVYYTFYENGTYRYEYESFASVDVAGMSSMSSDEDSDTGKYSVSDGQITLTSDKGGSDALTFRVVDDKYIQIGNAYFARR